MDWVRTRHLPTGSNVCQLSLDRSCSQMVKHRLVARNHSSLLISDQSPTVTFKFHFLRTRRFVSAYSFRSDHRLIVHIHPCTCMLVIR